MTIVRTLLFSIFVSALVTPTAQAADTRSIVAVFDIQTKFVKVPKEKLATLTDLMAEELGAGGLYQIMPPGDIKRALLTESKETYKECYDEQCQIQLGRQLAASKLLTTTIKKLAGRCRVSSSLYDLKKQITDTTAAHKCPCNEAGYVEGIEKVAAKLRDFAGGTASDVSLPKEDSTTRAPAATDDKQYKRALNQAWRKLAKAVRRGTTESKLEKYQSFLADFPDNNPHAKKVQRNIDALETKLEKQEAARLKAEERKAAQAAKRKRSQDLKAAYQAAKTKKGTANERMLTWQKFLLDYPDGNPYLKTAQRKVKSLEKAIAKEPSKEAISKLRQTVSQKAKVEFFTRSKCPYAAKAENQIYPVLKLLGGDVDFSLDYIGKIKNGHLESMFGQSDIDGNKVQLCAAKHNPDKFMRMVVCMNKDLKTIPGNWRVCALKASIDANRVQSCLDGSEGDRLLKASFERAQKKGLRGSPTIYIGGVKSGVSSRTEAAFKRDICKAFPGNRPRACSQ